MTWIEIEKAFNRAFFLSFSRKKIFLTFPILALCGVFTAFCRAVAFETSDWIALSFVFLPILISSGVLLALGVLLVRLHDSEVKRLIVDVKKLIASSSDLILGTSYLSVPPILAYLCLWTLLGIFFLLREIPLLGDFFSVVFSFGPFLLLFGSLILCLFNLGLLFFIAPAAALQSARKVPLAKKVLGGLRQRLFSSLALLFIALFPITILAALLIFAARLTDLNFSVAEHSLSVAVEWFFIMVPFCAILSPAVIFFFNFAAESYSLLQMGLTPFSPPYPLPPKPQSNNKGEEVSRL